MIDGRQDQEKLKEKVIAINRVAKVVKGGKRFSFNAIIVVGDLKGRVGHALGKANDVSDAIRKGVGRARKEMIYVPLKNNTIPYAVSGHFGASRVIIKPAVPGTGIVAGGPLRLILECVGVKDILTKTLGSHNHFNVVYATFDALKKIKTEEVMLKIKGKVEVNNETK